LIFFFAYLVKNPFFISSDTLFQLRVICESNRQVLTPVNNSELLLKLEILDKLRLVTFHKQQHKESATLKMVQTSSGEKRVLMILIHRASNEDARHQAYAVFTMPLGSILSLLCKSISLSHLV
jgi:hypothetical protein